jgi:hypothetical protein
MKILNIKNRREVFSLIAILLIFFYFGVYLILIVEKGVSPDEDYHINSSKLYSQTFLIPENSEETYELGDVTRTPYLSFWINGRVLNLNFTQVPDIVILRFFNLILSTGSLIVVYLISKEIINKKYFNLLPVFLLSNTLMFVFLSSSVNYDNLAHLFIFLTFYFLIKFFKYKETSALLYLVIFQALAMLTKVTMSAVVFIEVILLLAYLFRNRDIKLIVKEVLDKYKALMGIVTFLLILVLLLYGGNILKYGQIRVDCDKILTTEQCMENYSFSNVAELESFEINSFSDLRRAGIGKLTPTEYLSSWFFLMVRQTYGIYAHKDSLMKPYLANLYVVLFAVLSIILIRKLKREDSLEKKILVIIGFYTFILIAFQNYRTYLLRNSFEYDIHGRYIFPVLPLIYILFVKYLTKVESKWLKYSLIFLLYTIFLLGCIPYFFIVINNNWLLKF